MKQKLQLIYDQLVKLEPSHGPDYHAWNLAKNHCWTLLKKEGGSNTSLTRWYN